MALSVHRHGPLQPQDRRLGDARPYAHRTAACSTANGHLSPAARRRPDAPSRSRRSIRVARLSHSPRHQWDHRLDESQGRLLQQCTDGKLLPHAQNRAGPSPTICNTRRSSTRYLCLHRGLLQQDSAPFSDRLYQPDRDGAKSSLTLSTFVGEDQVALEAAASNEAEEVERTLMKIMSGAFAAITGES